MGHGIFLLFWCLQDLSPLAFLREFLLCHRSVKERKSGNIDPLGDPFGDPVGRSSLTVRGDPLDFFPLALIKCAYKGPSFEFNLMFCLCSNTFKVERLSACCTKYPFGMIKTVCKDNIAISQKLFFDSNLVHGLFIAYKALPPKALTGISMQIGVQIT